MGCGGSAPSQKNQEVEEKESDDEHHPRQDYVLTTRMSDGNITTEPSPMAAKLRSMKNGFISKIAAMDHSYVLESSFKPCSKLEERVYTWAEGLPTEGITTPRGSELSDELSDSRLEQVCWGLKKKNKKSLLRPVQGLELRDVVTQRLECKKQLAQHQRFLAKSISLSHDTDEKVEDVDNDDDQPRQFKYEVAARDEVISRSASLDMNLSPTNRDAMTAILSCEIETEDCLFVPAD